MIEINNIKRFTKKLLKKVYPALFRREYSLINYANGKIIEDIEGKGHSIFIMKGCKLQDISIHIRGENNKLTFEKNCIIGPGCSFWLEGNDNKIIVGEGSTFTMGVHFSAQEHGTRITIGKDCMFSNTITVRTSDSHPIYDADNKRINPARDITIGNHVWVAPNTRIYKGVTIGDGAIIGSDTLVTKDIAAGVLAVGHPAKTIKENISWTREDLF